MLEQKEMVVDRDHVISVIKNGISALKSENSDQLLNLSNQTIHEATYSQDPGSLYLIVNLYSLGKIISKGLHNKIKSWKSTKVKISSLFSKSISSLQNKNDEEFSKNMMQARSILISNSGNLKSYMESILEKASLNKASKLYEHGVSMGRTADLLNLNRWDLNQYAGSSQELNSPEGKSLSAKDRAKMALEFFS